MINVDDYISALKEQIDFQVKLGAGTNEKRLEWLEQQLYFLETAKVTVSILEGDEDIIHAIKFMNEISKEPDLLCHTKAIEPLCGFDEGRILQTR